MRLWQACGLFVLCVYWRVGDAKTAAKAKTPDCDFIELVKCFIDVLDEWAWTLYELKNNVVTINKGQCEHLHTLGKCVGDTADQKHNCQHDQVINASRVVSDLLTHRVKSGTFLQSYYLLTFACTKRGQDILANQRTCLASEHIGQMTISAASYLSDKFLTNGKLGPKESCKALTDRIKTYQTAMKKLCEGEGSEIMCKSLLGLFKGLYPTQLASCDFNCDTVTPTPVTEATEQVGTAASEMNGDDAAGKGSGQNAVSVLTALLAAMLPVWVHHR